MPHYRKQPMKPGKKKLERVTPLKTKTRMKRSTKRLPATNPRQIAKREARYDTYLRSATWKAKRKEALERAGYQCERRIRFTFDSEEFCSWRCTGGYGRDLPPASELHVHHKTYARFGGEELPDDLEVLCPYHHAIEEAKHPTRKRRHRHQQEHA